MAKRLAKQEKRRPSGLRRAWRIFYGVLVAVAAIIVVGYGAFRILVKPPEVVPPPTAALPSGAPASDNPDTPEDESQARPTPVPLVRQDKVYTFLLAASDYSGGNADTIMVVKYDVPNQTVGVVSILRDTMTEQYAKINEAYGHGVDELKATVSDLLGIPIDYYVTVNMKGFKALVNAVGGVDFYIPCDMNYDDTTPGQEFRIHFQKGTRHLNGDEALLVARFRHNNPDANGNVTGYNDMGRTQTQQNLITAVLKKVLTPSGLTHITEYIDIFNKYVKTDLGVDNMLYFATSAKDVDLKNSVSTNYLPGTTFGDSAHKYKGVKWCWQLDAEESLQIINSLINPYTTPITKDMVNFVQVW